MPVMQLAASPLVIVASPRRQITIAELIALAKPGRRSLNYGSTGIGNPLHLTMEMLKTAAGIDLRRRPTAATRRSKPR